ncbi:MAG: acetyltransferase [Bryobacteraceae bacterium]
MVLIGGGGHARVIADILETAGAYEIAGFTSGEGAGAPPMLGYHCLGGDDALESLLRKGISNAFIAIGDNARRCRCARIAVDLGFQLINALSPHAVVSRHAILGAGVAVMPGAVINAGARIGDGVIINTNASVDHDCEIGSFAHICPGCALAGAVRVGEQTLLGTGCRLIPGVSVGASAQIGAGSVVTRDVADLTVALGIPARAWKRTSPNP